MKIQFKDRKISSLYPIIKNILFEMNYEMLSETNSDFHLSAFMDGKDLKLMDIKIELQVDSISILIFSNQLLRSSHFIIADPISEITFASLLQSKVYMVESLSPFKLTQADYLIAG